MRLTKFISTESRTNRRLYKFNCLKRICNFSYKTHPRYIEWRKLTLWSSLGVCWMNAKQRKASNFKFAMTGWLVCVCVFLFAFRGCCRSSLLLAQERKIISEIDRASVCNCAPLYIWFHRERNDSSIAIANQNRLNTIISRIENICTLYMLCYRTKLGPMHFY